MNIIVFLCDKEILMKLISDVIVMLRTENNKSKERRK